MCVCLRVLYYDPQWGTRVHPGWAPDPLFVPRKKLEKAEAVRPWLRNMKEDYDFKYWDFHEMY